MELNIIATGIIIALYAVYATKRLKQNQSKDKHPIILSVGLTPLLVGTVVFMGFLAIEAMYGPVDTMPMVNTAFELFTYTFALIVLSTFATVGYFVGLLFETSFPFIKEGAQSVVEDFKKTDFSTGSDEDYAEYLKASEQWEKEDEQWRSEQNFAYMYESNNY